MHQLNEELLEQLTEACKWIIENKIQPPNISTLYSLLSKAVSLLNESQADAPRIIQYQKLTDEKKQPFTADEEGTEP